MRLVVQDRSLSTGAAAFLDSIASDGDARIVYFSESILPWVDGVSRTLGQLFDDLEARGRQ